MPRKQTPAQARKAAAESDFTPLYAVAGLTDALAEVLQQLAKALRISAETLYVRAGILDPDDHPSTTVEMAVLADGSITERQKRVLIDVYGSFVKENEKPPSEPSPPVI